MTETIQLENISGRGDIYCCLCRLIRRRHVRWYLERSTTFKTDFWVCVKIGNPFPGVESCFNRHHNRLILLTSLSRDFYLNWRTADQDAVVLRSEYPIHESGAFELVVSTVASESVERVTSERSDGEYPSGENPELHRTGTFPYNQDKGA